MSDVPSIGAFAIVPSNDLEAATLFWERLGFKRTGGIDDYVIMEGWGCEVHLTQAGPGVSIGVQKGPPIGVQKGPPSSSSVTGIVTGITGAPFALVAA